MPPSIVRLNDQDVETVRLPAAAQAVQRCETVWLPTGRLRPCANTLTIDFDPGRDDAPDRRIAERSRFSQNSSIDFRGLPHSVILPRLELFADAGYPFTAWADPGRTAVVIPEAPTRGDHEALLTSLPGRSADRPVRRRQPSAVTTAARLRLGARQGSHRPRDAGVAAAAHVRGRAAVPLDLSAGGLRVNAARYASRLLYPEWPFLGARIATASPASLRMARSVDTVVEQFVSPVARDPFGCR